MNKINTKGTLTEKTYAELKRAIIELDLKPGQLIYEDELAANLGVSRTPVRSALSRLAFEGLVNMSRKGTYVSPLSREDFSSLMIVRNSLEMTAVEYAAKNRTDEDIRRLKELNKELETYLGKEGREEYVEYQLLNNEFHLAITDASKNTYLTSLLQSILDNCCRHILATMCETFISISDVEHSLLIEYIEAGDVEGACRQMAVHQGKILERATPLLP